jgi:two-component system, NtrC family, response regulator HydG
MQSELIAVSGPLVGTCFPLGAGEVRIGRDPAAHVHVADPDAAWKHCSVETVEGRHRIVDHRTGTGTYVNGMRIATHWLEEGDQVAIGETTLVYRESPTAPAEGSGQHALLQVCSLLFLFRALATSRSLIHRPALEAQLFTVMAGFLPCSGGAVLLATDQQELVAAARRLSGPSNVEQITARVWAEGSVLDPDSLSIAVAIYAAGVNAGALICWFPPEEAANLAAHRDTLSTTAMLAAVALEAVRDMERLRNENALLLEQLGARESEIVGDSPPIRKLLQMIGRLAPRETSVLILGESGTGKELVARALHRQSPRASKPFVAINCAALTESLLESELFGHEKGAFTGAIALKKGKLESAEGGTVFLDEIGELAASLQAKLLRVLQQREFERVGSTETLKLDVRLVAATNRDLAAQVQRGAFREDLYHRLNVVTLRVPPLRDRPEDIPALANCFLERAAARCRRRVTGISPDAERHLLAYTWPGNVRELENAIEHAVVLGQTETLLTEDLPEAVLESAETVAPGALHSSIPGAKRQAIVNAWQQAAGDHNQAAELLHVHPNSLRRMIRSLNLRDVLS